MLNLINNKMAQIVFAIEGKKDKGLLELGVEFLKNNLVWLSVGLRLVTLIGAVVWIGFKVQSYFAAGSKLDEKKHIKNDILIIGLVSLAVILIVIPFFEFLIKNDLNRLPLS